MAGEAMEKMVLEVEEKAYIVPVAQAHEDDELLGLLNLGADLLEEIQW